MSLTGSLSRRSLGVPQARLLRRLLLTLGAGAAFLAAYPLLAREFGASGANVFVTVPVVVAAWSFGLRGGLLGAIVVVTLGAVYGWASGGLGLPSGSTERIIVVAAIGALVGRLSDLRRQVMVSRAVYAALVEQGPAMTYVWSRKRGLQFISSNVEALTGYTKTEWEADFIGLAARQLEDGYWTILEAALSTLDVTDRPMRASLRLRRRDGTRIWVDHHAECIDRTADDFTIQGSVIDMTARHELAEAQELSRSARAESDAKSRFLSTMSHELRTPLNSVLGFAELLEAQFASTSDERQARYVANIRSSGEHLLALINDNLDMSKIAADQVHLSYEEINARAAVAAAVEMTAPLSDGKRLTVTVMPGGEDLLVRADRLRLRQILINLVSNALRFTDVGAIRISCADEDGMAAIRVSDSGPGIPGKRLKSIFDEFAQVGPTTQSQSGAGLGLPLSRRLARAMGGDVTVASWPDRGSTFTLSLPIASVQESTAIPVGSLAD